jgi:hypothetical protein
MRIYPLCSLGKAGYVAPRRQRPHFEVIEVALDEVER